MPTCLTAEPYLPLSVQERCGVCPERGSLVAAVLGVSWCWGAVDGGLGRAARSPVQHEAQWGLQTWDEAAGLIPDCDGLRRMLQNVVPKMWFLEPQHQRCWGTC